MPKRTQRRRRFSPPKALVVAALVAFVLVDVALVGYALTRDSGSTTGARPSAMITPSGSASPSPTPTSTAPVDSATPAATTYLSVVDATTAYRISAGDCPSETPAQLEKSVDAGVTWSASPVTTGMTDVTRLEATESAVAFVIGESGEECSLDFSATYTSGADFVSYPERLAVAWYLVPEADLPVHSPTGSYSAPCDTPLSLASAAGQAAALLCSDGMVYQTIDGASSWNSVTGIDGARALAASDEGFLLASINENSADCDGVEVTSVGADGVVTPLSCREGPVSTGDLAVSEANGTVWLMQGDTVAISTDGGRTWN
jgi:hypothetical protein